MRTDVTQVSKILWVFVSFWKAFLIFIFGAFVIKFCLPALDKKPLFKDYRFTKSHIDISVFLPEEGYRLFALLYQQNHKPAAFIKAE